MLLSLCYGFALDWLGFLVSTTLLLVLVPALYLIVEDARVALAKLRVRMGRAVERLSASV